MSRPPPANRKPVIIVSSAVYEIEELLEESLGILNGAGFTVWMSHKGAATAAAAPWQTGLVRGLLRGLLLE